MPHRKGGLGGGLIPAEPEHNRASMPGAQYVNVLVVSVASWVYFKWGCQTNLVTWTNELKRRCAILGNRCVHLSVYLFIVASLIAVYHLSLYPLSCIIYRCITCDCIAYDNIVVLLIDVSCIVVSLGITIALYHLSLHPLSSELQDSFPVM